MSLVKETEYYKIYINCFVIYNLGTSKANSLSTVPHGIICLSPLLNAKLPKCVDCV